MENDEEFNEYQLFGDGFGEDEEFQGDEFQDNVADGNVDGKRPHGWNSQDPVNLDFIVNFWQTCYRIPQLRPRMNQINLKVQAAIAAKTVGWCYVVLVAKPSFLINTVGALLEIAEGPVVNAVLPVRDLLSLAVRIPPVQGMLKLLRNEAYPLLVKAGKIAGAAQGVKNIKEAISDVKQKGIGQAIKDNVKDRVQTPVGRFQAASHMRSAYAGNKDKLKESSDLRKRAKNEEDSEKAEAMRQEAAGLRRDVDRDGQRAKRGAMSSFSQRDRQGFRDARPSQEYANELLGSDEEGEDE